MKGDIKVPTKTRAILSALIGFLCIGAFELVAQQYNRSQTGVANGGSRLVITRPHAHLGGGAALSSNGRFLAYVGADNGLYILDVESGTNRLLVQETVDGMDVFSDPSFSPDGASVYFAASGGTSSYPSNIYVANLEDGQTRQLTHAEHNEPGAGESPAPGWRPYRQYFFTPIPSPDGAQRLLVGVRDTVQEKDFVELLDGNTGEMHAIAEGTPLSWSASATQVYSRTEDRVSVFNVGDDQLIRTFKTDGAPVVGVLNDDVVQVREDGLVTSNMGSRSVALSVDGRRKLSLNRTDATSGENLVLTRIQQTPDGRRRLTVYDSGTFEQIEVSDVGR
jgi:hypothetical protein